MIGTNIREVRAERGLSLREVAARIRSAARIEGLDYTAIQRIEAGKRKVASHELAELAEVLETTTARLFGGKGRSPALSLALRVSTDVPTDTLSDVQHRVVEILEAEDILERLVGPLGTARAPAFEPVPKTRTGGKALAGQVRAALDLGSAPIADLTMIVESAFGAHVSHEPLASGTHGFCVTGEGTGVVIVNSNDVYGRQRFTLAHELCHLIVDDLQTYEVVGEQVLRSAGAEGRADDFAAHFLAPDAGIRQMASGPVDAVGAIRLAHGFGMSLTAMLNRLRDLKLISPTTAEEAQREGPRRLSMLAGLTDDYRSQEAKVGRFAPPGRLTELATAAYNKGEIGPGLLAAIVGEQQFESVKASWGVDEHDDLGYQSHLA